jgi:hypothetical protein
MESLVIQDSFQNERVRLSLRVLFEAQPHYNIINNYARQKFNEHFDITQEKVKFIDYIGYIGFEIIDEKTIQIKYTYGIAELLDSFLVTIE